MKVKTIDYRHPEAAQQFTASLVETGFAVLTNHPIPRNLIDDTYSEWQRFFATPEKNGHVYDATSQAGYFPFRSENAKNYSVKDLKEFYHFYPTRRPLPENTRVQTPEFYSKMVTLGTELLGWIEDNTPEHVRKRFPISLKEMIRGSDDTLLRILHYPPLSGQEESGAVRAAAHEDINLITLLPAATAPGLQVRDLKGNWHDVACDPGMIAINAGDMLQETSRKYYPSTTHRVVNPTGAGARDSRYSMPLFLHARKDAPLTETLEAGQFLENRLREIGLLAQAKT